ncbi:P450-derived glycosyltransferase activator [Spirillospora sp. NPDC127200]
MPAIATSSELGRHLLTLRGFHFIYGAQGDPYALLLRAESDDRHALGREVRARGALSRSEANAWVTAGHGLGGQILGDSRLHLRHAELEEPQQHIHQDVWGDTKLCHIVPLDNAFMNLERADYARLAELGGPVLGAGAAGSHRAAAREVFAAALDRLGGGFDLVSDLARPAVVAALADALALPDTERERFAELCARVSPALDAALCPPQLNTTRALMAAVDELRDLVGGLVARRRAEPGDDLVGRLVRADGARDEDVLAACVLHAVVGAEAAANLFCNAVSALLAHPDQAGALGEDPSLVDAAVEETLRYDPPIRLESRIAHEDLELAGQEVSADSQIVVLVEAANRDPDAYSDPDAFDLSRDLSGDGTPHLALTGGMYASVVAPWVRAVAAGGLEALVAAKPGAASPAGLRSAGEALRRMRSPVVRALFRFPVERA